MTRLRFALAMLALLAPLVAAGQYRWVDKEGRTNFGDGPPRDAKSVQRLDVRGSDSADGQKDFPYELRRAAERFPVTLFTTASCQPCELARSFLRGRGVPYQERTVSNEADSDELRRISGGIRLPVMTVGRQAQTPFDPEAWSATLDAAGYPRGSMLPRSYTPPPAQPLTARATEPPKQPAETGGPPATTGLK